MTKKIEKYIAINESALYPILRRLVKEGYCDTYLKESSSGPARKYYTLTIEGKIFLHEIASEWELFVESVFNLRAGGKDDG